MLLLLRLVFSSIPVRHSSLPLLLISLALQASKLSLNHSSSLCSTLQRSHSLLHSNNHRLMPSSNHNRNNKQVRFSHLNRTPSTSQIARTHSSLKHRTTPFHRCRMPAGRSHLSQVVDSRWELRTNQAKLSRTHRVLCSKWVPTDQSKPKEGIEG